jgi:hypothetical protein
MAGLAGGTAAAAGRDGAGTEVVVVAGGAMVVDGVGIIDDGAAAQPTAPIAGAAGHPGVGVALCSAAPSDEAVADGAFGIRFEARRSDLTDVSVAPLNASTTKVKNAVATSKALDRRGRDGARHGRRKSRLARGSRAGPAPISVGSSGSIVRISGPSTR